MMIEVFDHIGIGQWLRIVTGIIEIIGAIALLLPRTFAVSGVLLASVMFVATCTHLFVIGGSPVLAIVLMLVTATIAWLNRGHIVYALLSLRSARWEDESVNTVPNPTLSPSLSASATSRAIVWHTRGNGSGGPITRLMSPSDLGQALKPFVFLDIFDAQGSIIHDMAKMPLHPHSGIATVTVFTKGSMHYDDPVSGRGTIGYGGMEWMRAGVGVWHDLFE